jgi:hypothetical protein
VSSATHRIFLARVARTVAVLSALGCDGSREGSPEPRASSRAATVAGSPDAEVVGERVRDAGDARADVVDERGARGSPPRHAARSSGDAGPPVAIDRVAGLDADRLFAVAGERLLRLRGGRWEPIALDGGVVRDVQRARDALWLLVQGQGANEGRVMIFRSEDGDGLALAAVASGPSPEAGAWSVRGLAVTPAGFYVSGINPALAFITASRARVEQPGDGTAWRAVIAAADDAVIATREDGAREVLRYGTRETVGPDGILEALVDPAGVSYLARLDGAIWRGRPAREVRRVHRAPPFEPTVVAALGDDRFAAVARGGPYAIAERGGGWRVLSGDWPSDPVAIVPCEPPLVVGRSGRVVAAEGQGRVLVDAL